MDKTGSMRRRYGRGEGAAAMARGVGASRDAVCKYAREGGPSPGPPVARRRPGRTDGWAPLVGQWPGDGPREGGRQRHVIALA
jgi:hypothetical protein